MTALTSEAMVLTGDLQQITPADQNATNALARGSLDGVVDSFLAGSLCYSGMPVQTDANSTARVIVGTGKLYDGAGIGAGFALRDPYTVDLGQAIAAIPADKFAYVAILAQGQDVADVEETRTFLDVAREPTNPEEYWPSTTLPTKTRQVRSAIISKFVGDPDVVPDRPSGYGASLCLIATVLINNVGIVAGGIEQNSDARITRLDEVVGSAAGLSAWRALLDPQFAGLKATVSALALQIASQTFGAEIARLKELINDVYSRLQAGTTAVLRGADYFTDTSQSATDAAGYNARVSEGLRFPAGQFADLAIVPTTPNADNIRVMGTKLMPAWTDAVSAASPAAATTGRWITKLKWSQFNAPNLSIYVRGFGVQRIRWNRRLAASSIAQLLSSGDPALIFTAGIAGDLVYDNTWGDWRLVGPELLRRPGFWRDIAVRGFWTRVLSTFALSGLPALAQAYRRSGAEMITSIDVPLEKSGTTGNLRLIVMGDINGNPDASQVYADVTVNAADLGLKSTNVPMPYPILKKAGQTIWMLPLTSGQHAVRALQPGYGNNRPTPVLGGPVKCWINGQWADVANILELGLTIHRASFGGGVTRVPCNGLNLAGGIDSVDIVAPAIQPDGCAIGYETSIGGVTVPIDEPSGTHPLTGAVASLPLTVTFTFTDAVAPIIQLVPDVGVPSTYGQGAYARLTKAGTSFVHVSATRNPPVGVSTVVESVVLDNWDGSANTLVPKLLTGGSFATETAYSTQVDESQTDGSLKRTWTWSGLSSVGAHRVKQTGGTSDQTKIFSERQANWSAAA